MVSSEDHFGESESPSTNPRFKRRVFHVHDIANHFGVDVGRRISGVALQQELGILSERRIGSRSSRGTRVGLVGQSVEKNTSSLFRRSI